MKEIQEKLDLEFEEQEESTIEEMIDNTSELPIIEEEKIEEKKEEIKEEQEVKEERKKLSSDIFFLIGLFLLPFENFFFAPSAGWATITPILFALYIALNLGKVLNVKANKDCLYFSTIIVLVNLIAYARLGFNVKNIINSLISLGLGFTSYFAMYIYYKKNKTVDKIAKIIFIGYAITFVIGLIEYLTVKFDVQTLYSFFQFVFKRNYLKYDRVQFFFCFDNKSIGNKTPKTCIPTNDGSVKKNCTLSYFK